MNKEKPFPSCRCLFYILMAAFQATLISCEKERDQLPFEVLQIDSKSDLKGIHKDNSGRLFVSGGGDDHGVVFMSSDTGKTWQLRTNSFDKSVNDIWMEADDSGFTVDKDVLIYSTANAGSSWNQYFPGSWPLSVNRNLRDITRVDSMTIVICGGKNFGNGLIYVSYDNGVNWNFTEYEHELRGVAFSNDEAGLAAGYGVVLRTVDNGSSWTILDSPSEYFTGITSGMKGLYFLCGFNGGLYRTSDAGNSWSDLKKNNTLFSSRDRFTCITSYMNTIVACGKNGLAGISKDNGDSWRYFESFNNSGINDVVIVPPDLAIAAGDDGKVYRFRI